MTLVKICGLNDAESVNAALDAGADWLGFVFAAASPRAVTADAAARLAAPARGRAKIAAVVVDASDGLLAEIGRVLAPDAVQLHGGEAPGRLDSARALAGCAVWKALPVGAAHDLGAARDYADAAMLVLDARPPAGAVLPGGHGRAFDWSLLRGWSAPAPWMLSGGLSPENVGEAICATGARAVDVSTGVERAPGQKDAAKIGEFIAAAKAATLSARA